MTDSIIHLRVPAATKARWVRDSRAAGMRLTDWIVERVDMQALVYDVTLYWHDGGSVFLGTVAAMDAEKAEAAALKKYIARSKAAAKEIEEGGDFQAEADLLLPAEAAKWWAQELNARS